MKKNKNKDKNNPIIVYWAPEAMIQKEHQQILLELPVIPVMKDIQKRRNKTLLLKDPNRKDPNSNGYQMCTALHELTDNLYYIKAPFDVKILPLTCNAYSGFLVPIPTLPK
jgi:hypothetical protein